MQLIIVRHGQSTNNAGHPRVPDPLLTEIGQEQAHVTAQHLQEAQVAAHFLYTSPMRRALQTTQPISKSIHLSPFVHPDVCETGGLSEGAGLTRQEITNQFEGYILSSGITEAGWSTPTLQEEGFLGSTVRAMRLWDMLCQRHLSKNETIVMVSHGDFVGHLLSFLFDTHPLFGEFFNMNNCAITTIHVDNAPKQPHLQEFNNTKHLLPRLITF